ncbi:MAG: hypothetical protein IKG93_05220 [Clostridiales bacterium]|jgi:ribosome-associated translation inhibitor RaiA|nr:hypothetical protein [Clostridiales bacterium]
MALAVKTRRKEYIDRTFEAGTEGNVGLNKNAFDDLQLERYMSQLDGMSFHNPKVEQERKKRIQKENKQKVDEAMHYYRQKNFLESVKRFRDFFFIALAIITVTAVLGLLVYNESQIASINFANNKLERQINRMHQETSQMKESLSGSADLEYIRTQASLRLGMVIPSFKQVENVAIPNRDHMATSLSYNSHGVTEEMLEEAKKDLAKYYAEKDA